MRKIVNYLTGLTVVILILAISPLQADTGTMKYEKEADFLQPLVGSNIYFGHQSVGQNIIEGIQDILNQTLDVKLQLIELGEPLSSPQVKGHIIHSAVGENTKPLSKCEDFNQIIRHKLADIIDVAMLKFCYIDINENTDVNTLFEQYRFVMDKLIEDFPQITFIHITTPLRHSETGIGIWLREQLGKFTGKPNRSKLANIKRNEFNDLLKSYYAGSPIFDLAKSMSTARDGTSNTFTYMGSQAYPHLLAEFTHDGGHLNTIGRRKVAEDFLHTLVSFIEEKTASNL